MFTYSHSYLQQTQPQLNIHSALYNFKLKLVSTIEHGCSECQVPNYAKYFCMSLCLIPVLLYSDLSFKYRSVHSFLNASSLYHFVRHAFNSEFCFLHLTTIKTPASLQHSENVCTSSAHFSVFARSLIFIGTITSFSTFLSVKSFGSPEKLNRDKQKNQFQNARNKAYALSMLIKIRNNCIYTYLYRKDYLDRQWPVWLFLVRLDRAGAEPFPHSVVH